MRCAGVPRLLIYERWNNILAFQPCPETAEIRLRAQLYGQQVENVWHCRVSTTPTEADLTTIGNTVADWVVGAYSSNQSNDVTFTDVIVTDLNVEAGLQIVHPFDAGITGVVDARVKTNQDTVAISLRTGHSGRSFRGRTYILAVAGTAYVDANHIGTATLNGFVANMTALKTELATAGFPLGVLSRMTGGAKPVPSHKRAAGILTDVTVIEAVDNVVDSQNRRLPGRGS